MSVPAFRNSKSKVRRRRSHHALKPIQVHRDAEGNVTLPHRQMTAATAPTAPAAPVEEVKETAPVQEAPEAPAEAKDEKKEK